MTLQRKFAALLSVLTLSVLVNAATALWALRFSERELVEPLKNINLIQPGLNDIKRSISAQAAAVGPGADAGSFPFSTVRPTGTPEEVRSGFEASCRSVLKTLDTLTALDQYTILVGISTTRNLRVRIDDATAAARRWFDAQSDEDRRDAVHQYREVHDLIERMEATVTGNAQAGVTKAELLSPRIVFVLATSAVSVVLATALGIALVRRWVVRPVGELRLAADRLAKGEFTYRVAVTGQDELGQLSAEVNHMAGMISAMQEERVDRERLAAAGEVVRRLAHNLRNPLAGIRSLAELTLGDLPAESTSRENQDRIVQTVDRFERWLAEMLSATTPLKLAPHTVQVGPWVTGVLDPFRALASSRGVTIRPNISPTPETAVFDPRHLEQAIVGIINNAIQASPHGGTVEVTSRLGQTGQSWELIVSDQGPGVPQELVEKIFRPYFTTKRDGTGIGLAVAKQVVEQHAGRIRVEPAAKASESASGGHGAQFVLVLPLAGPPQLANTGQGEPRSGARFGQDLDHRR